MVGGADIQWNRQKSGQDKIDMQGYLEPKIRGWQAFHVKKQIVNILGFAGHAISTATT